MQDHAQKVIVQSLRVLFRNGEPPPSKSFLSGSVRNEGEAPSGTGLTQENTLRLWTVSIL